MLKLARPEEIFFQNAGWLDAIGRRLLDAALREFSLGGLAADRLAMTLVVPGRRAPVGWSHRGDCPIYPASVVKLFYLVATHAWVADHRLRVTQEMKRALAAMIRQSSNDATNYIVDLLSGSAGGAELAPAAFKRWIARRQRVNRYFASWRWPEFAGINVLQKTWDDGPYGRELQARTSIRNGRNKLTTDATARLLWDIDRGSIVSRGSCRAMLRLLARDPVTTSPHDPSGDQVAGFFGEGLQRGARLWSKAGWTSGTRHDAAIIEPWRGYRFVLVAFTEGPQQATNTRLLPYLAAHTVDELMRARQSADA